MKMFVLAIVSFLCMGSAAASNEQDLKNLHAAAGQINSSLPVVQSDGTRVEKVRVGPGYAWTFTRTHLERAYSEKFREEIERVEIAPIVAQFCDQFGTFNVLKKGLITVFEFRDKDGKLVASTQISMGDCRK